MIERGPFTIDGTLVPSDVAPDDWNADAYERAVVAAIESIEASVTGTILISYLTGHVMITPYENRWGRVNALANSGNEWMHSIPQSNDRPGLGVALVQIAFTPAMFLPSTASNLRSYPGHHPISSEEVLFHELVHAVEQMAGTLRDWRIGPTASDVVPTLEHRAVRVANMFHSERLRPLRGPYADIYWLYASGTEHASHGVRGIVNEGGMIGFRGLRPVPWIRTSDYHNAVVQFEYDLAHWFVIDHPGFTMALEQVPRAVCAYNPFADYMNVSYDTLYLPENWSPPVNPSGLPYLLRNVG